MMMALLSELPSDDPLLAVVEEFLMEIQQGGQPSPRDYGERYPALASRILDIFPAIAELEKLAVRPAALASNPLWDQCLPVSFGRYELLQELGRGGMGVVYRAWDRDARRMVALKVIRPDSLENSRFQVEARVLARLEHDHVVALHDVGSHDGVRYFTMRLIEGGDLARQINQYSVPQSGTWLEAEEAVRRIAVLMAKVARAVGYVHRRGILHRDLKPGNILIAQDGQPLVSDFGLSRRFEADALSMTLIETPSVAQESVSEQAAGTRGYRAPEQARGREDLTTAVDIFGLGAILYRLIAGKVPFEDGTIEGHAALLDSEREAMPPSVYNPALAAGSDLEWICLTCLAKDPASRYATADALAEDLEKVARGEPVKRPNWGWPARVLRIIRRRKPSSDGRSWSQVDRIDAGLTLALHAGLFGLIQTHATATVCWCWFLLFESTAWWVFLNRLYRGKRTEDSERDLLVLWVGISLAGLVLFALYCPPTGASGALGLVNFYPPWTVVTGLGFFFAGRVHWGGLYVIGLMFLLLALLMPLAPALSPLAYGVVYAVGLAWMGHEHARADRCRAKRI